jgi:hypothetical protein
MADPELSYGVEPLLHDKDFQVQDFLDLYLPIDQLISEIDESLHRKTSRTNERDDSFVGLPVPNYPAPPRLKVNQLYWPTGASRWARGYFLCTENTKKSLTTISNKRDWTLKAVTELGTLETTLHLLPPRPVSNVDGSTTNLWLLPVVDDRYYWQFMDFGNTTINTWSSLIDDIAIRLGISITKDTPATDYISPDATLFNRKYDNAAVVLDAVAHSIGHRITRDLDGTVKSRNWDTHAETDADNIDPTSGDWAQIAGGQYWCEPVPQTLKVCLRS